MDLTYIIIAAVIVLLPFVLSKLFSGSTRDTSTVLGASSAPPRKPGSPPARTGTVTEEVQELLARGRKIEAIKLARERSGLSLAAAKDMIEMIEKTGSAPPVTSAPATAQDTSPLSPQKLSVLSVLKLVREVGPEVRRLAKAGKKIEAIQLIRDRTGIGLKEAKEIVDKLG